MTSALRALIFDVDGTLAETEELHRRAFNAAFKARGLPWHWSRERYRQLLRVTGGKARLRHFIDSDAPADAIRARRMIDELHADKSALYRALLTETGQILRPGVRDLIEQARAAGLRLAIATTTTPSNVVSLIRVAFQCPVDALFDVVVAGDAVERLKPAPDVYLVALQRLDLPASACLAIEDSRNGLVAALRAGLATVVTPSLYSAGEDFSGAALVVPSLDEGRSSRVGLHSLVALHAGRSGTQVPQRSAAV